MDNIFNSWSAMDCFCDDLVEAWIKHRKSKGKSCDEDSYLEWLEEFMCALESAFQVNMEDEDEED